MLFSHTHVFKESMLKTMNINFANFLIKSILFSVMLLSVYTCIVCMPLMFISVLNLTICKLTSVAN